MVINFIDAWLLALNCNMTLYFVSRFRRSVRTSASGSTWRTTALRRWWSKKPGRGWLVSVFGRSSQAPVLTNSSTELLEEIIRRHWSRKGFIYVFWNSLLCFSSRLLQGVDFSNLALKRLSRITQFRTRNNPSCSAFTRGASTLAISNQCLLNMQCVLMDSLTHFAWICFS